MNGFVYIFKVCDSNLYKIGATRSPSARLYYLQTEIKMPMVIFVTRKTNNAFFVEGELHDSLSQFRDHGEWYRFSETEVCHVQTMLDCILINERNLRVQSLLLEQSIH